MVHLNIFEIQGYIVREIERGRKGAYGTGYIDMFEKFYKAGKDKDGNEYANFGEIRFEADHLEEKIILYIHSNDLQELRKAFKLPERESENLKLEKNILANKLRMCTRIRTLIDVLCNKRLDTDLTGLHY